jgi:hypothetical protein
MGGKPRKAGKFTLSLRLSLWSEHLGLHSKAVSVCDCRNIDCSTVEEITALIDYC